MTISTSTTRVRMSKAGAFRKCERSAGKEDARGAPKEAEAKSVETRIEI